MRIEVHDSGEGIDADTQARLFKPFMQADESTTRRFGGTGLGLSICHELALLMGGRVGVDSTPGRGSCFWAELPLPRPSSGPAEAAAAPPAFDPVERLKGARVLMVEDNAVNMLIAVAMLDRWKVQVVQATDEYIGVRNAHVVLIDPARVRSVMTASWLNQMGWDHVYVLEPYG